MAEKATKTEEVSENENIGNEKEAVETEEITEEMIKFVQTCESKQHIG